jgi:O-antigen/teichoic acid export membrane protein
MLIKNSLLYVLARLLPGVFGMATTALLTRLLDVASYGVYGLALVIMTFVSTMGFDWLGVSFLRFYDGKAGSERTVATFVHIFFGLLMLSGLLTLLAWAAGLFTGAQAPIYALGILLAWSYSWFELAGRLETAGLRPFRYLVMNLGRAALIFLGAVGAAWLTAIRFGRRWEPVPACSAGLCWARCAATVWRRGCSIRCWRVACSPSAFRLPPA